MELSLFHSFLRNTRFARGFCWIIRSRVRQLLLQSENPLEFCCYYYHLWKWSQNVLRLPQPKHIRASTIIYGERLVSTPFGNTFSGKGRLGFLPFTSRSSTPALPTAKRTTVDAWRLEYTQQSLHLAYCSSTARF